MVDAKIAEALSLRDLAIRLMSLKDEAGLKGLPESFVVGNLVQLRCVIQDYL